MVKRVPRADSPRQTRASTQHKRQWGGVRPLPLNLQVLPPKLRPTPVNPGCLDFTIWTGARTIEFVKAGRMALLLGRGLTNTGQCRILLRSGALCLEFHTDDVRVGLAFCRAARTFDFKCDVFN